MNDMIWKLLILLAAVTPAPAATQVAKITVDPAGVARKASPLSAALEMKLPGERFMMLPDGAFGGPATILQVERKGEQVTLYWVERDLSADKPRSYSIFTVDDDPMQETMSFKDGDGFRDLIAGDAPIWRDMIKYDAADRDNTFKPYKHVNAFDADDGFITKGPGGKYTHHRGIFFGFKTQFGDFWHCPDVTQQHVKYLDERQMAGQVCARDASVTDWVGKDGKAVVRDTREVTTWRISPTDVVMDFDITVEALTDTPIELGGDAHHAGFHFRAAQEVAEGQDPKTKDGTATYIRSEGSKLTKNDIWEGEDWVSATFSIKDKPYTVTHFDAPTNFRPIQYSTRPYGRFGSFFVTKVEKNKPLKLKYRIRVRDGGEAVSPEQLAVEYKDYSTPVKVSK